MGKCRLDQVNRHENKPSNPVHRRSDNERPPGIDLEWGVVMVKPDVKPFGSDCLVDINCECKNADGWCEGLETYVGPRGCSFRPFVLLAAVLSSLVGCLGRCCLHLVTWNPYMDVSPISHCARFFPNLGTAAG